MIGYDLARKKLPGTILGKFLVLKTQGPPVLGAAEIGCIF
jgi:hypothetical protein